MPLLENTVVLRGGVTANDWSGRIKVISISADAGRMPIEFQMPSKGGGETVVRIIINPQDFSTILKTMVCVDRPAAMEAMSEEIACQIKAQPQREHELTSKARQQAAREVFVGATKKYADDLNKRQFVRAELSAVIREVGLEWPGMPPIL